MRAKSEAMPWPGTAPDAAGTETREYMLRCLRGEQNMGLAVVGAAVATVVGAGTWAGITVATEYQIGWMAVGIGLLVGLTVRTLGKGIDPHYGIVGAAFSLLGCALGNLLAGCAFVGMQEGVPFMQVVLNLNLALATAIMQAMFSPIDLLFYGIAGYEGYRLSMRSIEEALPAEA